MRERVLQLRWPTRSTLGHTDQQRGAGHWLVQSTTPERVAEEAARLRAAPVLVLRCYASFGAVDNIEEEALPTSDTRGTAPYHCQCRT